MYVKLIFGSILHVSMLDEKVIECSVVVVDVSQNNRLTNNMMKANRKKTNVTRIKVRFSRIKRLIQRSYPR